MKLIYPTRIGSVNYPAGTECRLATIEEACFAFPKIQSNMSSNQVSIFVGDHGPCIVDRRHITCGALNDPARL